MSALVSAKADPTEKAVNTLERLPKPYVAWLARAAAKARHTANTLNAQTEIADAAPQPTCVCGEGAQWVFSPCGHRCCYRCPWRAFHGFSLGQLPELLCPLCGAVFQDPALNFTGQRRGIIRHGPLPGAAAACATCGCLNAREWSCCINCNFMVEQVPVYQVQKEAEKEVSCFEYFLPWLSTNWQRAMRRRRTLKKWHKLPNEIPQNVEERLELQATLAALAQPRVTDGLCLDSWMCDTRAPWTAWTRAGFACFFASKASQVSTSPPKPVKRLAGAFRALSVWEAACERLGATRANRSERFRSAAEVGDARRVEAMLRAGVDVDSANEYGQTPIFLAAFEGHLDVVEARHKKRSNMC